MNDQIKVTAISCGPHRNFGLRYVDPATGLRVVVSSQTNKRREAERAAALLQQELRAGKYAPPSKISWEDFTWRYFDEHVPSLADGSAVAINTVLNQVERLLRPKRLADVGRRLSTFQKLLRSEGKAEATIQSYLRTLRAAMSWGHAQGMLPVMPEFPTVHRARRQKLMKGRPITLAEFRAMMRAVPQVVTEAAVPSWRRYLEGLWWSGLRLSESLALYWDRRDRLCVDLTGRRPMLWIPAELEKGNQDRVLPIAPEFAEFLLATPRADRHGRVFRPMRRHKSGAATRARGVSVTCSMIGKAAGVIVQTHPRTGKVKYASAHDLRRSFGDRWSRRVMPPVLQAMMRHEDIQTTMRYYVGRDAEATADVIWEAYEGANDNTWDNTPAEIGVKPGVLVD